MKLARLASVGRAFFREERKMFLDVLNALISVTMFIGCFYFKKRFDKAYDGNKGVRELFYFGFNCLILLIVAETGLILWKINH